MSVEKDKIYPECPTIIRTVEVGGFTKSQLLQKLQQHSILMNKLGERLFADNKFIISDTIYSVRAVELKVRDLGFPEGATIPQLFKKANQVGLELCPLELGPHLRLEYLDQPEGHSGKPSCRHRAPYGSVTIASEILSDDVYFPKGFYLRRIEGVLWLRGYIADHLHVLDPDDHFVFCQNETLK
ncbi:helicase [Virgibacillus indicus]|uniref:Helicase n=1 Tax=Virgibacillus indicus TaxID=2024554 RepID=A0A265N9I0_9BACI|nr:helicase [Virgibacillus indicus]OZU88653.1 helicase [Virgibacillus indicus]